MCCIYTALGEDYYLLVHYIRQPQLLIPQQRHEGCALEVKSYLTASMRRLPISTAPLQQRCTNNGNDQQVPG